MPLDIPVIRCELADAPAAIAALRERLSPRGNIVSEAGRKRTMELFGAPLSPHEVVARICEDVRTGGLAALLDYTAKLDGLTLDADSLRVTPAEFQAAHAAADPAYLATLRRIRAHVVEFQEACLTRDASVIRRNGAALVELRQRYLPLKRVGICVPGGAAAYPSTLLMTAIPAQVAGVEQIAVVVPPTKFGGYNADLLAACCELGITEVYRCGGAQGVAALAYGVAGMRRVDKIVGPGNQFVALAKRFVFGDVDIDSIAGPSEVVLLADETARADFVASDLISQAEHSPGSSVLITWSEPLVEAVREALARQLADLPRGELAAESLERYGALIVARNADEAVRLADEFAPEHLHISTDRPDQLAARIQNAGAIFLGHFTPVALGDYVAGPSHVLPTGGTARFANGLCAADFLKRSAIISYNREALAADAPDVALLADKEGLTAHRVSVERRLRAEG